MTGRYKDDAVRFQPTLFSPAQVSFGRTFARLERTWLDETAWIDFAPEWVSGADQLFEQIVSSQRWAQRTR